MPSLRKRKVEKYEQIVSADLEEEKKLLSRHHQFLMSISTSNMKMISKNLFLIMRLP